MTYSEYRHDIRKIAADWFEKNNKPVSKKSKYILEKRDYWEWNIILPEISVNIKKSVRAVGIFLYTRGYTTV